MTAWVLAACVFAADIPDAVRAVEQVFHAEPELAAIHRGYLAYLDAHTEFAEAEARVNTLRSQDAFARVVRPFEEWLLREPGTLARYAGYQDGVARSRDLPDALGILDAFRNTSGVRGLYSESPFGLELNAGAALDFLRDPQDLTAIPPEFVPYAARLQRDAALRERLTRALETVEAATEGSPEIVDWWMDFVSPGSVPEAVRDFDAYLREHVDAGEAWRNRMAAFGEDVNALGWVTYWHGRVRREPRLGREYYAYLEWLRAQAEDGNAALGGAGTGAAIATWPPETGPPALPPLDDEAGEARSLRGPERPEIRVPKAPRVGVPSHPDRPVAPVVPRVPRPTPREGG